MKTPPHYIPEPELLLSEQEAAEAEGIRQAILNRSASGPIQPKTIPPWKLLCYLSKGDDLMFHGSSNLEIEVFAPRRPQDVNPFGAQEAVYASSSGLWAMFYAILERSPGLGLVNSCVSYLEEGDELSRPHYFLSVGGPGSEWPFSPGAVYVLPRETFTRDPLSEQRGTRFVLHHWASLEPVKPLAAIPVATEDFPFLDLIRRHDPAVLSARYAADPDGFPWVDAP